VTKAGFGEHLKREREMRGVSLAEICGATRISMRFLQALENEEWAQLPGGVFNRGFVRSVARFLGLDEESVVAEYAQAIGEPSATTAEHKDQQPQQPAKTHWAWLCISALILVALVGAAWAGQRWYAARRAERLAAAANAAAAVPPSIPTPADAPASSDPLAVPGASQGEAPAAADAAATPGASPGLHLKVAASTNTALTVEADGKTIFVGSLLAGWSRTFDAQDTFDVETQDAGSLLLELNGQAQAPIGPPGHAGRVTLTSRLLHKNTGGPN
jgi:cytoskeleton protein RodZ